MPKNWYSIQSKQDATEVVVEVRIYDEIGFWGTTAKSFTDQLDALAADATRIVVSINSPGGNVFDAFAIYNALARHRLPVTTRVDGVAASAASMIFMSGAERLMPENAMLMIHNPWIFAGGTADELRNLAEMMDKARDGIVAAYARSGKPEAEIIQMMDETTWMDAIEAQAMGFATAMEEPVKMVASAHAAHLLERLPGAPQDLVAQIQNKDQRPQDNLPPPAPPPTPPSEPAPENAAGLVAHIYTECRARQMPHLAESVVTSLALDLTNKAAVDARLKDAEHIAGLCLAAKYQDLAGGFITAGLGVEQVRARLFDLVVTASDEVQISNLQRPNNSVPTNAGPNPSAIYAARKAHSA